ncbi:hypothetical protein QBC46DRAFT_385125 [Diplogelasinospora grovesii]|uniref:C2H2-type domain-containing protein n=1 Tax=Diplogelasinospora grovesii TaxID=303347 RepID=A0AAN6N7C6_9PEZI|nr:hypothetical protein QBC46DRAFT_385125 [Diplogelasinospora grovesii]
MKRSREPDNEPSDPAPEDYGRAASAPPDDGLSSADSQESTSRATKITELDPSSNDAGVEMRCSLPPHKEALIFGSYGEYESHYLKSHTNRCLECHRNFPSTHLLNVHIEEAHDAFAAVKREKGERTYSCFVEGCERKCSTPQKRRMHLIDKHMYPKNFFFAVTRDGIDGRQSLLLEGSHRRRKSSVASIAKDSGGQAPSDTERPGASEFTPSSPARDRRSPADEGQQSPKQKPDVEMDDLTGAMSALRFVPSSIRFGRGGGKAGFSKR